MLEVTWSSYLGNRTLQRKEVVSKSPYPSLDPEGGSPESEKKGEK